MIKPGSRLAPPGSRKHARRLGLELLEDRRLLSAYTYTVTNTSDSGPGSLRQAILDANASTAPGVINIEFGIPASTAPELNVPVPGFSPTTQEWTITPATPLPAITRPVYMDGFSQARNGVGEPYIYPDNISSASQFISASAAPTSGSFTLTTAAPLPVGTTIAIPYDAPAGAVQSALETIVGTGNVTVSGGPLDSGGFTLAFQGAYGGEAVPTLAASSSLAGASGAVSLTVLTTVIGGVPGTPTYIMSVPNSSAALSGYNSQDRVILDGSATASATGLVVDSPNVTIRGLIIDGFSVGVSIQPGGNAGDLIQGNYIGRYFEYPVNAQTGAPATAPGNVVVAGSGNAQQGITLYGSNATIGGIDVQAANAIGGNGAQGIEIEPGANGNQVVDNQIGILGPSLNGLYSENANGAEGVLILSLGSASNPASIVSTSSNIIGGAVAGSGNLISSNQSAGIHVEGPGAARNLIEANYIGTGPGGGYIFGTGDPGNRGDGVFLDNAPFNQVGGPVGSDGNVISRNSGDGVDISGSSATENSVANNIIGLISSGAAVLGNGENGVAVYTPNNTIGPANVISANLVGVLLSGATASDILVQNNLIGTDITGEADLGNALQGVLIQNASNNTIQGDAQGGQVISGNQIGVEILGSTSTGNLITGSLIGLDRAGSADRGNSNEGILIEGGYGNTVGGVTANALNVISANLIGVQVDGATAINNLIEGNLIGTDLTGARPLGNETNGVVFSTSASNNTLGGTVAGAGNTIDFNVDAGVSVQSGVGNAILSNSIYQNGLIGIDLVAPGDPPSGITPNAPGVRVGPNDLQNTPVVVAAVGGAQGAAQATLNSLPNTPFLIQFFTSTIPDPSGYGQGQTFLQSLTVTTDANGNAAADLAPPLGLPPNTWITTTATNLNTGDTSEFSNSVSAQPVSLQFAVAAQSTTATSGQADIQVDRIGNPNALVSVNYATANGTAAAGFDYTATSGTLTFQPGQMQLGFSVPILENILQTAAATTVNLALSAPTGSETLSAPASYELTTVDNLPPTIAFSAPSYTAMATGGSATITVIRGGNRSSAVSVAYSTSPGTAAPGVDYTPESGVLTFLAGQSGATFSIPLISDPTAPNPTVQLALAAPTGGAVIGATATATLVIQETPPPPPSPVLLSEQIAASGSGIGAIVLSFNMPLDPSRASDLANYGYYIFSAGPYANGGIVPLAQAVYSPGASSSSVTLVPARPLPLNQLFNLTVDPRANVFINAGLASPAGALLVGDGGAVGAPIALTFGVGSHLVYNDSVGNLVTLNLAHGGLMELQQAPSGAVDFLGILGPTTRQSTLSGSVKRQGASPGRTILPAIQGTGSVKIHLKRPPFYIEGMGVPTVVHAQHPRARHTLRRPLVQVHRGLPPTRHHIRRFAFFLQSSDNKARF